MKLFALIALAGMQCSSLAALAVTTGTPPPGGGAEPAKTSEPAEKATPTESTTTTEPVTASAPSLTGTPTQLLNRCGGMTLGEDGALNGFVPSPADAWHQDISAAPVASNSAAIISGVADLNNAHLHPDFGGIYGIPYNVVDSSQVASQPVPITEYASQSDITLAPLETGLGIENSPAACSAVTTDQHMLVLDRKRCVLYEYYGTTSCGSGYTAKDSVVWDMTTTEKRPYGYTSADAAGLSVFEGLLRYDEIVAGSINHAIRFTTRFTKNDAHGGYFVAPATHAAGTLWGTDNIMGMRIRLKADFDISHFSQTNRIILTAMKKYGMILADNGSTLYFQGTRDNRWDESDLNALKAITASSFEVVAMGTAYDTSTSPHGAAPAIASFTATASSVRSGTAVTLVADVKGASYSYIDKAGFLRGNTITVKPTATTTYTLTSRNAYGTVSKSVTVTVVP